MSDALEQAKHRATLQVLFRVARRLDETALTQVRALSNHDIRRAHVGLLAHIDLTGTRQTVIAERAGISKQAVGQLVGELVHWGLLERVPDPADGRAHLIRFVDGGRGLLQGLAVLSDLEGRLVAEVGEEDWASFRATLLRVQALLDGGWQPWQS